jgi:hypothetical protein
MSDPLTAKGWVCDNCGGPGGSTRVGSEPVVRRKFPWGQGVGGILLCPECSVLCLYPELANGIARRILTAD